MLGGYINETCLRGGERAAGPSIPQAVNRDMPPRASARGLSGPLIEATPALALMGGAGVMGLFPFNPDKFCAHLCRCKGIFGQVFQMFGVFVVVRGRHKRDQNGGAVMAATI